MNVEKFFEISIKNPSCVEGFSEDALMQLVKALQISAVDKELGGIVLSSKSVQVRFNFGASGNFEGVTARINGENIPLIPGVSSNALQVFSGAPSSINPGSGWKVETELTKKYLNQPNNELDWEIFYASREAVLNNIGG